MQKTIINVPEGITKLSQWTEFGNYLPQGKFILNKKITGCGATTYFLENSVPLILCSHRTELLMCKAKSPRHQGKVHLFKSPEDKTPEALANNMAELRKYLNSCAKLVDPFGNVINNGMVPKILVTTDSLGHVLSVLNDIGILQDFSVVSDEMQCIFTDAAFKGGSVLNYLNNLKYVQNVIYLSATPYLEDYLDKLDEFKNLLYIELNWPPSTVEDVTVSPYYVKSLYAAAKSRIDFYKQNGYFEENGYYKSTRAVFFINSITDIIKLIKNCNLDSKDVNIICSTTNEKTLRKLKKINLSPGHAQKEFEEHVIYTFVTKCSYEGVDLYHPDAYTYIFSNPNLSNMAMDLSIDLIQILGRQRLDSNPWKTQATIYYQTTKDKFKIPKEEFLAFQATKDANTSLAIDIINNAVGDQKVYVINKFDTIGHKDGYFDDYIGLLTNSLTGEVTAVPNPLIRIAEERAYDIRNELYDNKYQVLRNLCSNITYVNQDKIQELNNYFSNHHDFPSRMCFYCMFRDQHPELELEIIGAITVPIRYHEYYEKYGTSKIRSVSYREFEFRRFDEKPKISSISLGKEEVISSFPVGSSFSNKEVKKILQNLYDKYSLGKIAKATDIMEFFEIGSTGVMSEKGTRIKGIKILSIKQ